jgi:hypothetical protein
VADLVAAAQKFRKWVKDQPEATELRKAYLSEVTRLGWTDRLPRKAIRWGLFNAAGLVISTVAGPIAGVAGALGLSAFDTLLLDKLAGGGDLTSLWKVP